MKAQATTNDMLRIGVVHQGRIMEDHLFKTKARVTTGRSNRNGVSLPAMDLPLRCKLVDTRGGRQHLCFQKGMRGRVYTGGEVIDLRTAARRKLATRKGDRFYLPLNPGVRASVVMGDATFLFQHVRAPARQTRNILPKAARGQWWRSLDKPFLSVLALSLFAQGGFEAVQEMYWRETGQYLVNEKTGTPELLQTLVKFENEKVDLVVVEPPEPTTNTTTPDVTEPTDPTEPAVATAPVDEPGDIISEGTGLEDELFVPEGPVVAGTDGTTQLVKAGDANFEFTPEKATPEATRAPKGTSSTPIIAKTPTMPTNGMIGVAAVLDGAFGTETVAGVGAARHNDPWGGEGRAIAGTVQPLNPNAVWNQEESLIPTTGIIGDGPTATAMVEEIVKHSRPTAPKPVISSPRETLVPVNTEETKEEKVRVSVRGGKVRGKRGTGELSTAEVQDVIRKRTPGLQHDFMSAARKNPSLRGKITVRITVGASGRARVEIVSDGIHDKAFARTLKRRIASWKFPKSKNGEVSFKVPFSFRAI